MPVMGIRDRLLTQTYQHIQISTGNLAITFWKQKYYQRRRTEAEELEVQFTEMMNGLLLLDYSGKAVT